jgi:hypothetical protein
MGERLRRLSRLDRAGIMSRITHAIINKIEAAIVISAGLSTRLLYTCIVAFGFAFGGRPLFRLRAGMSSGTWLTSSSESELSAVATEGDTRSA